MAKKRIPKKIIRVVQQYSKRLEEEDKLPIDKVIIFGSYAKGKPHKWSDVDVCVISPKFKDTLQAIQFLLIKRNKQEIRAGLEPVGFSKRDFQENTTLNTRN